MELKKKTLYLENKIFIFPVDCEKHKEMVVIGLQVVFVPSSSRVSPGSCSWAAARAGDGARRAMRQGFPDVMLIGPAGTFYVNEFIYLRQHMVTYRNPED